MSASANHSKPALDRVRVLVTRPAHQAQRLRELIEARGGQVLLFPVLDIVEAENSATLDDIITRLDEFDIAIFISANAVNQGVSLILGRRALPPHLKLATVGQRTAKELEQYGLCADICPSGKFNSEALLALDEMHDVRGKNIVIFRGEGGREFLADTLRERGAQVEYAEVYRRAKPQGDSGALLHALMHRDVDIVTVTSNEGLRNLFDLAGSEAQPQLRQLPLVVISERQAELARELGFQHPPQVSSAACDEALVEAIINAVHGGMRK
ncbi:MAG: uroporphyrinogen-III synthase [Pseudomonadota bacterium]